jgi:hypothetical protein
MPFSVVVSLILAGIGGTIWLEGGPHPRTRGAWLLLVAILIVAALPVLLCCWAAPVIARLHARHLTVPGTEHTITIEEPPTPDAHSP